MLFTLYLRFGSSLLDRQHQGIQASLDRGWFALEDLRDDWLAARVWSRAKACNRRPAEGAEPVHFESNFYLSVCRPRRTPESHGFRVGHARRVLPASRPN